MPTFPFSRPIHPKADTPEGLLRRIIHFLTFVNQPIKRRFSLFYLGVMWWFIVMTAISSITFFLVRVELNEGRQHVHPAIESLYRTRNELQVIRTCLNVMRTAPHNVRMDLAEAALKALSITKLELNRASRVVNRAIPVGAMLKDVTTVRDTIVSVTGTNDSKPTAETVAAPGRLLAALERVNTMDLWTEQGIAALNRQLQGHHDRIARVVQYSSWIAFGVLFIATLLLTLFTYYIRKAIGRPISSLIRQVDALVEGNADLSARIHIASRDEIGVLTEKLNQLTEKLHELAVFKRIIEEDPEITDVYARLADVFHRLDLNTFTIYEMKEGHCPEPVYPQDAVDRHRKQGSTKAEKTLCRAIKANRMITSMDFPGICSRICKDLEQDHACIPIMLPSGIFIITQFVFDKVTPEERESIKKRLRLAVEFLDASRNVLESKKLLARLRENAIRDPLTGLYNRRFLSEIIESIIPGVRRRGERLGIAVCDIDHFKEINDSFGHQAGDAILKTTASVLNQSRRESDIVIRYGGEEFLVIFRDLNSGDVLPLAERIRSRHEHSRVQYGDRILNRTISIGTSIYPDNGDDIWDIIYQADEALYQAKRMGRNQVVSYHPPGEDS